MSHDWGQYFLSYNGIVARRDARRIDCSSWQGVRDAKMNKRGNGNGQDGSLMVE